jgi:hypothetical protein
VDDRHLVCAWCNQSFTTPSRRGPAPLYCSAVHRNAAYRARLRDNRPQGAMGLVDEVRRLRDEVAELRAAVGKPAALQKGGRR